MLDYLSYTLFFGILIAFLIYIYIRVKYGFWAIQPVFHVYDFGYMLKAPGIINHQLPTKNKYTNFKNIETLLYSEAPSFKTTRFLTLIREHYLQNKDNIFSPTLENITPYFQGHNDKSFISFYNEDNVLMSLKKGTTINEPKIIGVMTGRPLHVIINNGTNSNETNNNEPKFDVYYIDYLCVDKSYRKK